MASPFAKHKGFLLSSSSIQFYTNRIQMWYFVELQENKKHLKEIHKNMGEHTNSTHGERFFGRQGAAHSEQSRRHRMVHIKKASIHQQKVECGQWRTRLSALSFMSV